MKSEDKDCFLDLKSLAPRSCLSVRKLRDLIKFEGLSHYRVGGKILVKWSEFNKWMSNYRDEKIHQETEEIADEILKSFR